MGVGVNAGCLGSDISSSELKDGKGEGDFPEDDIRIVVPFSAGGGYDEYARFVAKYLPNHSPNAVSTSVQNVEGAGGQVAVDELWNTELDGYIFNIIYISIFIQDKLIEKPEWNMREFSWLPQVAADDYGLFVGVDTGIENWNSFIEAMESEEIQASSSGPTAGGTVSTVVLGEIAGLWSVDTVLDNLVVTDGKSQSIQLVMSGDADYVDGTIESIQEHVEAGNLRMIIGSHRSPDWADNPPTFEDVGIDEAEKIKQFVVTPRAFATSPNTSDDRLSILRSSISDVIQSNTFQKETEEARLLVSYGNAKETRATVE